MDFIIGKKVFCYYDDIVPLVEGEVIENDYMWSEGYQKIHWNEGGISYFPIDHIFESKQNWEDFYSVKQEQTMKQDEDEEYALYLTLKEKYEK